MPCACSHDVVGGALENGSCCCIEFKREVRYGEAKEWLDAFFDCYLHLQLNSSHPWCPHGLLTVLGVQRDVHDNIAATSFAHAPYT